MNEEKDISVVAKIPEPSHETLLDLKAAREALGFSLSDVFCSTRVSMINLTALENWDFDRLPPPVYTRNFIRKYAQAIGVDERPILNHYEMHLEGLKPPLVETDIKKPWSKTGWHCFFLFGGLIIAIVIGILVYTLYVDNQSIRLLFPTQLGESTPLAAKESPAPTLGPSTMSETISLHEQSPVIAKTTEATMANPVPEVPLPLPSSEKKAEKNFHLIIEAKELTWARITEDHNSPYQVLLKPGDRIERRASDFFYLDIGNAGGIDLTFQGKPMESLGKQGQVLHMRLPEKERERKTP